MPFAPLATRSLCSSYWTSLSVSDLLPQSWYLAQTPCIITGLIHSQLLSLKGHRQICSKPLIHFSAREDFQSASSALSWNVLCVDSSSLLTNIPTTKLSAQPTHSGFILFNCINKHSHVYCNSCLTKHLSSPYTGRNKTGGRINQTHASEKITHYPELPSL